jgi:hypothetical protein
VQVFLKEDAVGLFSRNTYHHDRFTAWIMGNGTLLIRINEGSSGLVKRKVPLKDKK